MCSFDLTKLNDSLEGTLLSLHYSEKGLSLKHPDFLPLQVDFLSNKLQYRTKHSALSEMVAKACGAKHKPSVLDLTAGLGRDAFLLASLGCKVQMVERNPIMHALLQDGLKRLKVDQPFIELSLLLNDSQSLLPSDINADDTPHVIYIDPMHPHREKSALVKKEMRILRELVGEDLDKEILIAHAFSLGIKKVVVKWPSKVILPIDRKPTGSIKGKSTRFDIFSCD